MKPSFHRPTPQQVPGLILFILGGAILVLAFLSLWQRNQMIHIGYEIEQLRQERAELLQMQKELLIEAESLSAMERVERIAVEQLGMNPPLSGQRVYMKARTRPSDERPEQSSAGEGRADRFDAAEVKTFALSRNPPAAGAIRPKSDLTR